MRSKISGLIIAVILSVPLVWSLFRFTPAFEKPENPAKILTEQPKKVDETNENTSVSNLQVKTLMNFFGQSMRTGKTEKSVESFCSELAETYKQRGFRNYQESSNSAGESYKISDKNIFWLNCESNFGVVNAVSSKSDLFPDEPDEKENSKHQFTTVIEKKNNGVYWETYKLGGLKEKFEGNLDLPGEDPPIIPRIDQGQRIFGLNQSDKYTAIYLTEKSIQECAEWYKNELTKLQFAKTEVPSDEGIVIFFTKGKIFSTIWLSKSDTDNKTIILITLQK